MFIASAPGLGNVQPSPKCGLAFYGHVERRLDNWLILQLDQALVVYAMSLMVSQVNTETVISFNIFIQRSRARE